ncbi:acylphosphatase [candidate division WOR-3 bacterium JGI_Cruoil_03_44_89]|uniref:acylphosphatase n=1 Tax=candidate division WOR-3 bacterium JGI_Cruoil_03_44_89 TaxID=1973748 RepID=A0A235BNN1_UNCW3|nr:MAG: acylphosphatase [candidate division WOR-3 bacterium JGI_Cruoil_03_44_89]
MVRAHMLISGLVQGVCYRWFARKEADSLGLTGYVKNLYDARVEVVVEGERGLIEEFIKMLKVGPSSSDVRDLKIEWREYKGEFSGFAVRY